MAAFGQVAQRQVAGGKQAHVDLEGIVRANGAHIAALQRFEQAFLHGHGQAVDLVDHQGAAVAMLQGADLPIEGAGEGAFFVAEQGGFERVRRNPASVDQPQRQARTRAGGMHRAHQHFLAGAAFALDQHVRMAARRLGRHGERRAEGGGGADHRLEIGAGGHLFGQRCQFVTRGFTRGGAAQGLHQAVRRHRLNQIVRGAGAHGFHRQQGRCAGRQHQDRQAGAAGLEFGNQ